MRLPHRRHLVRLLCWLVLLAAAAAPARAVTATLIADAHVSSAQPATNFGTLTNLAVGNGYTTLLQFDLGALPAGTTAAGISRATLRLYVNRADTPGLLSLSPVLASWAEYSVTANSQPRLGAGTTVVQASAAGAFLTLDVTSLVAGWIAAPSTNFGLALSAGTAAVQLDSKENDLTSHAPELDITLVAGTGGNVAGSAGPTGPAGPTGATGPQGLAGAPGVQGPAAVMNYQGLWSSLTTYPANAVVNYVGSSFLSLAAANRGNTPGLSPASWGLLAAAGQNGVASPGSTGQQTLTYQGTYSSFTNYALGDIVQYQGSSFTSLTAANHGNAPGLSPSAWGLLAAAQAGPQGPLGPAGPTGPLGLQGPFGPAGPQGVAGPIGAIGPQGSPGLVYRGAYASLTNYALGDIVLWQGITYTSLSASNHGNTPDLVTAMWGVLATQGPAGPTGPQGLLGPTGAQGFQGVVGPPGSPGPTGPIGIQGPAGAQGLAGPQGPRGDLGAQGLQGLTGQAGAQGIPGVHGDTGLQGPMGPSGPAGPVGLSPQGVFSSSRNYALGDAVLWNGSGYVSLVASNLGHTPDQSPAQWSLFAAAGAPGTIGPAGPPGATGLVGPQGGNGLAGPAGPTGATGPQGPPVATYTGAYNPATGYALNDAVSYSGSTWISLGGENRGHTPDQSPAQWSVLAARGLAGPSGAAGPSGPAGAIGPSGASGITGPQGPQGQAGPAGTPGINFRGDWLGNAGYQLNDAVSHLGSTWIAVAGNSAVEPGTAPSAWSLLAAAGLTGPTGSSGSSATVRVGSVTTGAPGSSAVVTNSGTSSAVILNFTLPAGAPGAAGTGSGPGATVSTSGIPFASVQHAVNFASTFFNVNTAVGASTESNAVLTWIPNACTATGLSVFSTQANTLTVTLRTGTPGAMQASSLVCSVSQNTGCSATGSVAVAAGTFVDLSITGSNGSAASVWTAVACQ